MFAPQLMATRRLPDAPSRAVHFLMAATASAPDGSTTQRVSSKMSWMPAQISSVSTQTISSTRSRARRKVSSPTRRTATPSAKVPTRSSATRSPACSESRIAVESAALTPMMRMRG